MNKEEAVDVITFLMLHGKKAPTEKHREKDPVFRIFVPSHTSEKNCWQQYKFGRSNVAVLLISDWPASVCNDENTIVKKITDQDRKMKTIEMASKVKLNEGTVNIISYSRLNIRKMCACWVTRQLTREQMQTRLTFCYSCSKSVSGKTFSRP